MPVGPVRKFGLSKRVTDVLINDELLLFPKNALIIPLYCTYDFVISW